MSKALGSWGGMRKYLEQEMLAKPLQGRVRYGCTSYVGMDGCRIFELCLDGKQFKRFSWETVNSYFIIQGYKSIKNPSGTKEYWAEFWPLLEKYPITERTEYTDEEFAQALSTYRNQDIQISIKSENPLIRMFAILDRRIGKRTLQQLAQALETQPPWLQELYQFRITAE